MVRLHNENQLHSLPGSALKVCVVVGGWVVESEFSDCLWLSFSLAMAKPNNKYPPIHSGHSWEIKHCILIVIENLPFHDNPHCNKNFK